MASQDNLEKELQSYTVLCASYVIGLIRLLEAETAALKAKVAIARLRKPDMLALTGKTPLTEVLDPLLKVSPTEFDAFCYLTLTDISYLVYGTTLLTSFLSDTTKFMLLRHPAAVGKETSVRLDSVIAAITREDLITAAVTKKVRELGYLPFLARIEFLRSTFKLPIDLDRVTIEALEHCSGLRNVIIHDQSVFDIVLGSDGKPVAKHKTCPRHPTKLAGTDLKRAEHAYKSVVSTVMDAVVRACPERRPLIGVPDARQGSAKDRNYEQI